VTRARLRWRSRLTDHATATAELEAERRARGKVVKYWLEVEGAGGEGK
jgi:hypothetical protein